MNICPVCGSSRRKVLSIRAGLAGCLVCSHVSSCRIVAPENRVFEGEGYRRWRQENQAVLRKRAAERIKFLATHVGNRKGRVFEFGCGTGETLAAVHALGWKACGVDLSTSSIEIARNLHPDIQFAVGASPEALGGDTLSAFDLVMGFHVAEHVPDLHALAASLLQWCRPGGLLCLFVPNWACWSRRAFGDYWPSVMPEHIHQFTPESMRRWLADAGFEIVCLDTASSAWHWLGGLKRRLGSQTIRDVTTEKTDMPSRSAMTILDVTSIGLRPLFWLERRHEAGPELRVLARRVRA